MNLCLIAAALTIPLGSPRATLAWTHSVEKVAWEEDWQAAPAGLILVEARVRGSGAGMEPPPEARLEAGFWRWHPHLPAQMRIELRRSSATADWRICIDGTCRAAGDYVPADADPIALTVCVP